MPLSDEQLLRDFSAGQRAALGDLAARYEHSLLGLAHGLLSGRAELAKDAVQETWLRVIRFGGSFNGKSTVKTWLYRILINQCRTLGSEESAHDTLTGLLSSHWQSPHRESLPPVRPPSAAAEELERSAQLRRALGGLTPDQKNVILLCYHEGLTHEESAGLLDIPLGTLKSRLHAALTELRKKLPPENPS